MSSAPGHGDPYASGAELIARERQRQVDAEGWTPAHDDKHRGGQIALAAASYALPPGYREMRQSDARDEIVPVTWPEWWPWKPGDRVRELTKAGALIAAEIDRLQREQPAAEAPA